MLGTEHANTSSALIGVTGLLHQFPVLTFSSILQLQMCPALPLLVYALVVLLLFVDEFSRLIALLFDDLAVAIDSLQRVPTLGLVPLHHSLSLDVERFIVWDQVHSHIFEEVSFSIGPQMALAIIVCDGLYT